MINQLIVNPWAYACVVLFSAILYNILIISIALLKKIELNKSGKWFENADCLGEEKKRLQENHARIEGTLVYWKNRARAYEILNNSRVLWSLISSGLVPVLLQVFDRTNTVATIFMVSFTTWTGFIVVAAFSQKSEEKYRGFRQVESAYYDISRHVLDFPEKEGGKLTKQVDIYLTQVEQIRDVARKIVETGSPPEFDFMAPLKYRKKMSNQSTI